MAERPTLRRTRNRTEDTDDVVPEKMKKVEADKKNHPKSTKEAEEVHEQQTKQVLGDQNFVDVSEDDTDGEEDDQRGSTDITDVSERELEDPFDEPTDPEKGMKLYMQILEKAQYTEFSFLPHQIRDYLKMIDLDFESVRINGKDVPRATIELVGMFVRKAHILSVAPDKMLVNGLIQVRVNEQMVVKLLYVCAKLKCPSLTFHNLEQAEHLLQVLGRNHPILKLVAVAKRELEWIKRPGFTSFHTLKAEGKEEPVWDLAEKLYNEMIKDDTNLDYECKIFLIWALQNHSNTLYN